MMWYVRWLLSHVLEWIWKGILFILLAKCLAYFSWPISCSCLSHILTISFLDLIYGTVIFLCFWSPMIACSLNKSQEPAQELKTYMYIYIYIESRNVPVTGWIPIWSDMCHQELLVARALRFTFGWNHVESHHPSFLSTNNINSPLPLLWLGTEIHKSNTPLALLVLFSQGIREFRIIPSVIGIVMVAVMLNHQSLIASDAGSHVT